MAVIVRTDYLAVIVKSWEELARIVLHSLLLHGQQEQPIAIRTRLIMVRFCLGFVFGAWVGLVAAAFIVSRKEY